MTDESTRAGARWMIPWVALVLVAIFAFMQLDAAQRARGELTKARDNERAAAAGRVVRQEGLPRTVLEAVSKRERVLDDALSHEQAGHREAQARVRQLEEQLAAERARADRVEALRATERARADALERHRADVAENLARTKALLEKGQSLVRSEPVRQWLEDITSGDKTRVAYARARAAEATPEQIEALRVLLRETEPGKLVDAAHIARGLPAGAARSALIGDLILALPEADVTTGLDRIVSGLLGMAVFERVLESGSNRLRDDYLRRAAANEWTPPQRLTIAQGLRPLLDAAEPETVRVGTRGFAFLRLAGAAEKLVDLLQHEAPAVRAGAAYGLTAIPDRDPVAAAARAAVPALLGDANFDVRAAGALLAEALLGGRVEFRPSASADERAKAIAKIKARLGS